ncbi:FCD domain-containing protein, partial [Microbacterium memoriense]
LALDAQFHLRLTDAAGNVVVAATMAGLRPTIDSYIRAGVARITDWDATADRLRHEHHDVLRGLDPRSWTRCRFGYAASARVADVVSA